MTNYTKTTNFASKDTLPSGNANKIVKGTEIDTEFNNIATAVATKADTAGPTLTGTTTFETISDGTIAITAFVDEDNMASDSATLLPTQQSVKAYVDSQVTAQDLDVTDGSTSIDIDLDSESLGILGGTGIDSTASGTGVTLAIDSTVATLTGSQTLSNKTLSTPVVSGNLTTDGLLDGRDVATDGTKLDTVETNADVTDTTNVTAAGALMDSEVTNLDQVKAFDSADYATAAQGTTADNALPKTGGAMTGAITTNSTFDGRDVATDGTKLDGIEASADVTDTANVTAAGALMDSELTDIAAVKALNQGVATTDSPTFAGIDVTGTATADGLTVDGSAVITTDGNTTQLTLKSTDADASVGPRLDLTRDSASPAADDIIGVLRFLGNDSAGNSFSYGTIQGFIGDPTDGSEDGKLVIQTRVSGGNRERISMDSTELVINESSRDSDFRVESDNNTHALFVQGSDGNVGIGTSSPGSFNLNINGAGDGGRQLKVEGTGTNGLMRFSNSTAQDYSIGINSSSFIIYDDTANSYRMVVDASGNLLLGTTSVPSQNTGVSSGVYFVVKGDIIPSVDAGLTGHSDLGDPSTRYEDAYVRDGVTTGSDGRDKQDIEELSDAEQRVAVACKGLLRKWRWKSSVAEKGDDARIHFGIIAQDLQAAFTAEGLDAGRYAMFISSTWTDEDTGEERTRLGVRYSELLAFIISAI